MNEKNNPGNNKKKKKKFSYLKRTQSIYQSTKVE